MDDRCAQFLALHQQGIFVMPNPWDVGSAKLLETIGFPALASTSSGLAMSVGRRDQTISLDELLRHAEAICTAVRVPLNLDAERCYADTPDGIARVVALFAATGAAGFSIEDFDPVLGRVEPMEVAVERVASAAEAARRHGMVLTARAENLLYRSADDDDDALFDDTIARLCAYRDAGAEVLYAPGLRDLEQIGTVVRAVDRPINVLTVAGCPSVDELGRAGVRRISTGGALARAAYGALLEAARTLHDDGTSSYVDRLMSGRELGAAFGV